MSNKKRVLIIDSSILCCWLQIPHKEICGPTNDRWDYDRVEAQIRDEIDNGAVLVLPVASLIETGNHIAHSNGEKYQLASSLCALLHKTILEEEPWAAFEHQAELWKNEKLTILADSWPDFAIQGLGIGDATIKDVANYYYSTGAISVEILTGDQGLKAHEPPTVQNLVPRRRRYE